MLIDYIDSARLPFFVVWLDWNVYAYKLSLTVCLALGLVIWMVWCWLRYGPAVG